jgi:NMD protein affecting ribosome stability and mRNA decay
MFCIKCGTQLPEEANFCMKCGHPQTPVVTQPPAEETQWEHCKIDCIQVKEKWSLFGKEILQFVARKEGCPDHIAASKTFQLSGFEIGCPSEKSKLHRTTLQELVDQLKKDSWEPSETRPSVWYRLQFRRR